MRRQVTLAVVIVLALMPLGALGFDPSDVPDMIAHVKGGATEIKAQLEETNVADVQTALLQDEGDVTKPGVLLATIRLRGSWTSEAHLTNEQDAPEPDWPEALIDQTKVDVLQPDAPEAMIDQIKVDALQLDAPEATIEEAKVDVLQLDAPEAMIDQTNADVLQPDAPEAMIEKTQIDVLQPDVPEAMIEETKIVDDQKLLLRGGKGYEIEGEGDYMITLDIPKDPIKDMSSILPYIQRNPNISQYVQSSQGYLIIKGPNPGGLFHEWNEKPGTKSEFVVQSGDLIMEVNNIRGTVTDLFAALQKKSRLVIRLLRQPLVITADTTLTPNVEDEVKHSGCVTLPHMVIKDLKQDGPFGSWNDSKQAKESKQLVSEGDLILQVNGIGGRAMPLFLKLRVRTENLVVLLRRHSPTPLTLGQAALHRLT